MREDGRKNGWYHLTWTRSEFGGEPSIHDHTVFVTASTRRMADVEDVFQSESVTDLERSVAGDLLSIRVKTTAADRVEETETSWTGASYAWTYHVAGREERRTVASPKPLPVDTAAFLAPLARSGALQVGQELSYDAANYLASRLDRVLLHIEGREDVATPSGTVTCWRVRQTFAGRPGESTWWLDDQGVLAKVVEAPSVIERATEAHARRLDPSEAAYSITMPSDPDLPRATSLDRCVVDVSIDRREDVPLPDFPATPFSHELSRGGDTIRVELTAHDVPDATITLPVETADPALAKWLEANNLYAPEHPAVKRALRQALASVPKEKHTDGRTVAVALLRYVFATLRKESGPTAQPTAPEILADGMGDCSEHAVLFVALCRAAGLPARRLSGYAQVGDMWGAHSFCEVWLGRWIGADPTTNELGTRARYLAFGWDEDPDSYPGLVSSRVTGHMSIRTVEFTDAGTTLTIAQARKRKPLRDDLSGLVLAPLPEHWTADVGGPADGTTIQGPGISASITVSAGMGDIDAELLRETQFRSGRIEPFGGVPSLRIGGGAFGRGATTWIVPWRRRLLVVSASIDRGTSSETAAAALATILAPTLTQ